MTPPDLKFNTIPSATPPFTSTTNQLIEYLIETQPKQGWFDRSMGARKVVSEMRALVRKAREERFRNTIVSANYVYFSHEKKATLLSLFKPDVKLYVVHWQNWQIPIVHSGHKHNAMTQMMSQTVGHKHYALTGRLLYLSDGPAASVALLNLGDTVSRVYPSPLDFLNSDAHLDNTGQKE